MTHRRSWRSGPAYRRVTASAVEQTCAAQARRRAARWYSWLKNPKCTFQDRENFERWYCEAANAAAYDAFCRELAGTNSCDDELAPLLQARALSSAVEYARLEANER
jgi:ferric-dicitrate binding protein FerR (iron transport regulator)